MKKTLIALAAVAATGAVMAQSSVTLFGNVDIGVRNVKPQGGSATWSMSKNLISSSALGFRGVEDLGGGMSAGFHLEGDLDPDTGTAGGLQFQRRSTLSLMGGFGELRLGRDYTPTFWNHTVFDPFGTNGLGSSVNLYSPKVGFQASTVRANNTIGYFLPAMGGFYGQFQYAIRESTTSSDYTGVRVGYRAGPLDVAIATAAEVAAGAAGAAHNPRRSNIGVSYDLGFMKPMFQYTVSSPDTGNDVSNMLIGLTAPVGPGLLRASYVVTDIDNVGDGKQIAIGYTYPLSKRTSFNANIARTSGDNAFFAAGTANTKQTGYEIGVRHSF